MDYYRDSGNSSATFLIVNELESNFWWFDVFAC